MRSSYQIHKMNTIYKSREVLECMCSWEGQVKTKISLVESDTSKLDDHLLPKLKRWHTIHKSCSGAHFLKH